MVKERESSGKSKKPLIVMKFGGTSVGTPERMQCVAEILEEHTRHADVVAVVSAMGGATNIARYVAELGPAGRGPRLTGLYDAGEGRVVRGGRGRAAAAAIPSHPAIPSHAAGTWM